MSRRVLVCGGRHYKNPKVVGKALSELHEIEPFALVITGGAPGADGLAQNWAEHRKIPVCVFPANWRFVGRAAGPIRNGDMLKFAAPDIVVAFAGGTGTENMIKQARAAGVDVVTVESL